MPPTPPAVSVDDVTIPALGFGTASMTGDNCRQAVEQALEVGYRNVDTAQMYDNEATVGAGIIAADVECADVFVTTKLDRGNMAAENLFSSAEVSLDRLNTGHVDLLLIRALSRRVRVER